MLYYVIITFGEMMNINIMSFNIRIDVSVDGKHAWPYREKHVLSFIKKEKPDLLGIQEAGPHMVESLKKHLDEYDLFVEPRDERGESTPILIKKNIFKILEQKTIWLTDTPHQPSNIKGSNHPRIATYIVLETKNHQIIHFFNTHLDYTGDEVTLKQVQYLHDYMNHIEHKYGGSTILCGDFNSYPKTKTITYLETHYVSCFKDIKKHRLTFHGYSHDIEGEPIDYIFYSKTLNQVSLTFHDHIEKDLFLSDHYPISSILTL